MKAVNLTANQREYLMCKSWLPCAWTSSLNLKVVVLSGGVTWSWATCRSCVSGQ